MTYPKRVTLELTNRCNRACRGCPRHKMTYPLGDMSLELLAGIVSQLPSDTVIVPFFRGESAAHPQFLEAISMLRTFKTVQMATNGDFLTGEKEDAILESCSFISYSLHEPLYPESIPEVAQFLDDANYKGLDTQVSILETEIPDDHTTVLAARWLHHADRFRVYVEHSKKGFGDVDEKYKVEGDGPCRKPFTDMVVYWDGKVGLCNHDWDNGVHLGDLNTQTVEEVWNGDPYNQVRYLHHSKARRHVPTCVDCDYWKILPKSDPMLGELYERPARRTYG